MPILDSINRNGIYNIKVTLLILKTKYYQDPLKLICDKNQRQVSKFIYVAKRNARKLWIFMRRQYELKNILYYNIYNAKNI